MAILHTAARTMLASMFVYAGVDALRNPGGAASAEGDLPPADDAVQVARTTGAVQVGAGLLLASGRLRRPAALALAGTLVPATPVGSAFWEADAGASKPQQVVQLLKNVGLLGGLLIAAMDTEGEPGVAWRAQHAVEHASTLAEHAREVAGLQAELTKERARAATASTRAKVGSTTRQAKRDAKAVAKVGRTTARSVQAAGRTARKAVTAAIPG